MNVMKDMPLSNLPNRVETIKYLEDINERHQETPFEVLQPNYVEQLKATLNYAPDGSGFGLGNINIEELLRQFNLGLVIKTVNEDYTVMSEDFNNRTLIRANADKDQIITLIRPSEDYIGKSLTIRKTNGDVGTFVTIQASSDTSISPQDITPLRRVGSTVTMVYIGNGLWDMFGELS